MARKAAKVSAPKATTFRIESVTMSGLEKLSRILNRPLNKLANDAVREYVARRIADVEADLTSTLEELRAYRKSDPNFDRSLAEFIRAETAEGPDPLEGTVVMEDDFTQTGPSQHKIQKLLNG